MKVLRDYEGRPIRLTDERLAHILDHPEMTDLEPQIEATLAVPQSVIQSASDDEARLSPFLYRNKGWRQVPLCGGEGAA